MPLTNTAATLMATANKAILYPRGGELTDSLARNPFARQTWIRAN